MNFLFQFLIDRSIDRSYGKWSTPVLNNSLSCIAQKVTFSNVFLFISLLRQKKNPLPPFAMERLGSICSYGNNDSRFKIWRYTFYHFRSYSTWKIVAISAHCIMKIHHCIFHRFFSLKKREKYRAFISLWLSVFPAVGLRPAGGGVVLPDWGARQPSGYGRLLY